MDMKLVLFAAIAATATAQVPTFKCMQSIVTPMEGACGGERINTKLCVVQPPSTSAITAMDNLKTATEALGRAWATPFANRGGSCDQMLNSVCLTFGGPNSRKRALRTGEKQYPMCVNAVTCNPAATPGVLTGAPFGAVGQPNQFSNNNPFCDVDANCGGANVVYKPYMMCCNSLRYWIETSCTNIDTVKLNQMMAGDTSCKSDNADCYTLGAASSLSAATMFTAVLALVTSLMVSW